jgi:hypothetical protein
MEKCETKYGKIKNINKTIQDIEKFCKSLRANKVKESKALFLALPLTVQCLFLHHAWDLLKKGDVGNTDQYLTAFRLFKLFRGKTDKDDINTYTEYGKLKELQTYYKKALDWNKENGGSKTTKSSSKSASSRSKKKYDKEGQKYEEPKSELDPLFIYYTSLYRENPKSKLAISWLTEHGVYEGRDREKLLSKYGGKNEKKNNPINLKTSIMSTSTSTSKKDMKGPHGLSMKTGTWLTEWMSGGKEVPDLNIRGIKELKHLELKTKTQLFRGLKKGERLGKGYRKGTVSTTFDAFQSERFTSWTKSKDMAKNFSEDGVISIWAEPKDSLIDTTLLDPQEVIKYSGFPDEQEVILLPGTWKAKYEEDIPDHVVSFRYLLKYDVPKYKKILEKHFPPKEDVEDLELAITQVVFQGKEYTVLNHHGDARDLPMFLESDSLKIVKNKELESWFETVRSGIFPIWEQSFHNIRKKMDNKEKVIKKLVKGLHKYFGDNEPDNEDVKKVLFQWIDKDGDYDYFCGVFPETYEDDFGKEMDNVVKIFETSRRKSEENMEIQA